MSELTLEPLAEAENAWPVLQRAAAMKPGVDSPRSSILEHPQYPPYGPEWEELAAASEAAHGPVFDLARKARRFNRARLRAEAPTLQNAIFLGYNASRNLANTLADAATHAHLQGDDAEAVARLREVLHLAAALRQDPFLISELVAIGIDALALEAAQVIAPALDVDGGQPGAASREQVRALIAVLLDDRDNPARLARMFHSERALILDMCFGGSLVGRLGRGHEGVESGQPAKLRVVAERADGPRAGGLCGQHLAGMDEDWPQTRGFQGLFGSAPAPRTPRYSRWFAEVGPGALGRTIELRHRTLAERRATAVSLAARLYRLDHDGRWPDDLAALVPAYLPAVPADPFLAASRPLGYVIHWKALPDGGDRPLVYFGPADFPDAGLDTEPMFGWQHDRADDRPGGAYRNIRQYRDLALWLPTVRRFDEYQKSLDAVGVDEEPDEPDALGDGEQRDPGADAPPEY